MHHWKYAYATQTVKKKPELALNNTKEYCYHCHQAADAFFILSRLDVKTVKGVLNSTPLEVMNKILDLCLPAQYAEDGEKNRQDDSS